VFLVRKDAKNGCERILIAFLMKKKCSDSRASVQHAGRILMHVDASRNFSPELANASQPIFFYPPSRQTQGTRLIPLEVVFGLECLLAARLNNDGNNQRIYGKTLVFVKEPSPQ